VVPLETVSTWKAVDWGRSSILCRGNVRSFIHHRLIFLSYCSIFSLINITARTPLILTEHLVIGG
jgi:hypothetical protein